MAPEAIAMRGKGLQAIDWHEGLTAVRGNLADEVSRLEDCGPAATAINLPRLKRLIENWPESGWEKDEVLCAYRLAMLRAVSTGHFLRRASGSNARNSSLNSVLNPWRRETAVRVSLLASLANIK